ncbi:MAG: ATP-binding protein [Marinicellaceae bacterium]
MQFNSRKHTFFWIRNFLIFGQLLLWVLSSVIWNIHYPFLVIVLTLVYFGINLLTWLIKSELTHKLLFIHLIIDVTELTLFFYLTGGASNPFTWFLIVPIIYSATVLSQKYTWIITAYSIISYTLLIKFFQPIESSNHNAMEMNHSMDHSTSYGQHLIGMWLGFIVLSVLISWVISSLMKNIRLKENLLLKANAEQAENDKMLALATLATGSAHELGTPLATINIIAKELLNDDSIQQHHKLLNIIEAQISRCKESLTNITASTGTTQAISGSLTTIDALLKSVKNRIITTDSSPLKWYTNHDQNRKLHTDKTLVQALVNIINNAIESQATNVMIKTSSNPHSLFINIVDNGEGLIKNIEPAQQSNKEFGLGLGLFLAKTTIKRFSGDMNFLESSDQGTNLRIQLPLVNHE